MMIALRTASVVAVLLLFSAVHAQDETERLFWESVDCRDDRQVRAYLEAYPSGAYVEQAFECIGGQEVTNPVPATCSASDWVGTWDTTWNEMTLEMQSDGSLSGVYNTPRHRIGGTLSPDDPCVLVGRWQHRNSSRTGRIRFQLVSNDEFEGTWTYGDDDPATGGSGWTGTKR
jgi:hypothetical protein